MLQSDDQFEEWLKQPEYIAPYLPRHIQLQQLLAVGGQGVVHRGLVNGEDAAVKVYFPGQVDKRVERETRALQELSCDSIVDLLWTHKLNIRGRELNVVATSYVDGTPLNELIERGELDQAQLAIIAYDVSMAIEAMWAKRIVHRDLKPSNILIRANGRACVIDLGVARHLNDSSLTQMGATWGTAGYLSPEQTKAVRQLTCKSDMFALGVILVEGAMRRHPTSRNQYRLLAMDFHEQLPRQLEGWQYADLLKSMLHPHPTKRPLPRVVLDTLAPFATS